MKKRCGFVSNSSSASFTINWEFKDLSVWRDEDEPNKKITVDEALVRLFDVTWLFWRNDNGDVILIDELDSKNKRIYGDYEIKYLQLIKKYTKELSEGKYESTFWTSMLNSPFDFPVHGQYLLTALMYDDGHNFNMTNVRFESE
jgi:hypothetical protein